MYFELRRYANHESVYSMLIGIIVMRKCLVFVCLIMIISSGGLAREWSEQIQMTHAEENDLDGVYFHIAVDSHDEVHMAYAYKGYDNDEFGRRQPVYQKFNRFGEPLTEPIVIGIEVELPDSESIKTFDIFVDRINDDQVYVLWGNQTLHFTKFNRDGEIVTPEVFLEGITIVNTDLSSRPPQIVVNSDEDVYVLAEVTRIGDPMSREFVSYGHYTQQGELFDTLHVLQADLNYGKRHQLQIHSDTLYAVWAEYSAENNHYESHFSKIAPNDEVIVDNVFLPISEDDVLTSFMNFGVDSDNGLVFSGIRNRIYYLTRFNNQLEVDWFTDDIGRNEFGDRPGDLIIDEDGHIHVIDDINDDNFNDGLFSIAYSEFDEDGNIVDSLQFIHDQFQREVNRNADWSVMRLFVCSDGTVGIIWNDGRYDEGDRGDELFMRYSSPDNDIVTHPSLLTVPETFSLNIIYPNPFNSSATIEYQLPVKDHVKISIYSLNGTEIEKVIDHTIEAGYYSISLNADDLPTGIYFCRMNSTNFSRTMKLVVIK